MFSGEQDVQSYLWRFPEQDVRCGARLEPDEVRPAGAGPGQQADLELLFRHQR